MSSDSDLQRQAELIHALAVPGRFPHPVNDIQVIETHVSWIVLTGPYAYKIKKAVNLGFLDYSALERRHLFCREELRLNGRTAPDIYLEAVPISGTATDPLVGDDSAPIEYAVKMRQFDQSALLGALLARGAVDEGVFDGLAREIALFHGSIDRVPLEAVYGTPASVLHPVSENFVQIRQFLGESAPLARLEALERWSAAHFEFLTPVFEWRKREGFIRECHGDLHLNNIAMVEGHPTPFDGIEFNPNLRYIDTASEIAFLTMDLDDRGHHALGQRFLNRYLEYTGDFEGLRLLRFYQAYRAMVRAKVAAIRLSQPLRGAERAEAERDVAGYLSLAERYTAETAPALVVMHGLSGSGKSMLAARLSGASEAVRLRSDVERKRLYGLGPDEASDSALGSGIYSAEAGQRTYARLATLAEIVTGAGLPVIIDATTLKREQRETFRTLARRLRVPCALVHCAASEKELRDRVTGRRVRGGDASEATVAVLESQLAGLEPLGGEESDVVTVRTDEGIDLEQLLSRIGLRRL